jgi:hypothetical protein
MANDLLTKGWDYHATESARLAGELEAAAGATMAAEDVVPFARLGVHTIGEHLEDWPRARRLAERVLDGRTPDAATARAWAHLSIARLLAGDPAGAAEAELGFLGAAADFRAAVVEARFMLVAALVGSGRTAEATALYRAALVLGRTLDEAAPHRAIAVASNNLARDLLEEASRTDEETALMVLAAEAAHAFWLKCGTWVNEERALYLRTLVANALERPAEALVHADAALALIAAIGGEPVDAAFLNLARAHALQLAAKPGAGAEALELADAAAAGWDDAGLKDWYAAERARTIGALTGAS